MSDEIGSHLFHTFNNCLALITKLGDAHHQYYQHCLKKPSSGQTHASNEDAAAANVKTLRKAALPKRAAGHKHTDVVPPKKRAPTIPLEVKPHDNSYHGPAA